MICTGSGLPRTRQAMSSGAPDTRSSCSLTCSRCRPGWLRRLPQPRDPRPSARRSTLTGHRRSCSPSRRPRSTRNGWVPASAASRCTRWRRSMPHCAQCSIYGENPTSWTASVGAASSTGPARSTTPPRQSRGVVHPKRTTPSGDAGRAQSISALVKPSVLPWARESIGLVPIAATRTDLRQPHRVADLPGSEGGLVVLGWVVPT